MACECTRHEPATLGRAVAVFGLICLLAASPFAAHAQPDPGKALEALIADARAENKAQRSLAIQRLGRLGDRKALPVLIELLEDPDAQVRILALEALAALGDPSCLPGFLERFRDSQPVVVAAASREVIKFRADAVVPALLAAMRHRTAGVRDQAARAFEHLTKFQTGFDSDAATDQREDVITRWEAWWESARGQTPEQWWIAALSHEEAPVRKDAAMALRSAHTVAAIPGLLRSLTDSSESVRLHAGLALSAITGLTFGYTPFDGPGGDRSARDAGVAAWKSWWEQARGQAEPEWYLAALRDTRAENRAAAANRLAERRYEPAVTTLIAVLADESPTARQQAARAVSTIVGLDVPLPSGATAEELRQLAGEWRVWWDINRARGRQEWLADSVINGKAPATRASAAKSLAALPTRRSAAALLFGLNDPAGGVRAAAIAALEKITHQTLDYSADAPDDQRRRAITRWQEWLETDGRTFPWSDAGK